MNESGTETKGGGEDSVSDARAKARGRGGDGQWSPKGGGRCERKVKKEGEGTMTVERLFVD